MYEWKIKVWSDDQEMIKILNEENAIDFKLLECNWDDDLGMSLYHYLYKVKVKKPKKMRSELAESDVIICE